MSYIDPDQPQNPALNFERRTALSAERRVSSIESTFSAPGKNVDPAALGKDAKYVGHLRVSQEKRRRVFRLQKGAAKLLDYKERVANCRWSVQRNDQPVEVHLHRKPDVKSGSFASYYGLQTCASVWHCPYCARKISEVRRGELNSLLSWAREQGFVVLMMTLTTRHERSDSLGDQVSRLKDAKRRMRQRRDWKAMKTSGVMIGTVTATEVTHGQRNGWHTHFHELIILNVKTQAEGVSIIERLRDPWIVCLKASGLDGLPDRAFQVQGASAAGTYVTKWGVAEELTLAGEKRGRGKGRTPLQLLADTVEQDDYQAGQLWKEFALTFKGKRQLVWSNGLRDVAGIDEISDEEASDDGEDELLGMIDRDTWVDGGARLRRALILEEAENTRDPGAVFRIVHDRKLFDPELRNEQSLVIDDKDF